MIEKNLNSRIQHKHDTEANWNRAYSFIPKAGELIIYDADSNYSYPRVKIGDGTNPVTRLRFLDDSKLSTDDIFTYAPAVILEMDTEIDYYEGALARCLDFTSDIDLLNRFIVGEQYIVNGLSVNYALTLTVAFDSDSVLFVDNSNTVWLKISSLGAGFFAMWVSSSSTDPVFTLRVTAVKGTYSIDNKYISTDIVRISHLNAEIQTINDALLIKANQSQIPKKVSNLTNDLKFISKSDLNSETWTFVLDDGSTVTKGVYIQ